jgi:hypothetical protein
MARAHKGPSGEQDENREAVTHNLGVLEIPELSAAEAMLVTREWTPEEDAILRRYYKRGMVRTLVEYWAVHFPPGRSADQLRRRASRLGITGSGPES